MTTTNNLFTAHVISAEKLASNPELTNSRMYISYNSFKGFNYTYDSESQVSIPLFRDYIKSISNYFNQLLENNSEELLLNYHLTSELSRFTVAVRKIIAIKKLDRSQDLSSVKTELDFIDENILDRMRLVYIRDFIEFQYRDSLPEFDFAQLDEKTLNTLDVLTHKLFCSVVNSPKHQKLYNLMLAILKGEANGYSKKSLRWKQQISEVQNTATKSRKDSEKENINPQNVADQKFVTFNNKCIKEAKKVLNGFKKVLHKQIQFLKKQPYYQFNDYRQELQSLPTIFEEAVQQVIESIRNYHIQQKNSLLTGSASPIRPSLVSIKTIIKETFNTVLNTRYMVEYSQWSNETQTFIDAEREEPLVRSEIRELITKLLNLNGKSGDTNLNQLIFPILPLCREI